MSKFRSIQGFRHDAVPKAGVLLLNLGSPDAPEPKALRRYLKEFLSDPRVVEFPRWAWWLVLNLIILNVRPRKSAALYREVWTEQGSPLLMHSRAQEAGLRRLLETRFPGRIVVSLGMRYGNPSVASALETLLNAGVRRLLVLPLYPQYSGSTNGSTFDAVSAALREWRWVPELRFISDYHDHPRYIEVMARHIENYWQEHGRSPYLLFSFHGIPKRYLLNGDPYYCHCHKTARLLAQRLDLRVGEWQLTFQSRFGREEWLQPYTDKTLESLPAQSIKAVDVFCPGFSADCLETLEEIAQTNRALFLASGGTEFRYIPALNATEAHIEMIAELLIEHGCGWPEFTADYDSATASQQAREAQSLAIAEGAEE